VVRPHADARSQAPPRGACVWLTGLSGSGKSTTARAVAAELESWSQPVKVLDGDELRARISHDLGFSKRDRDTHVLRVAALAKDVVDHGAVAVCALVSPYREARQRARDLICSERFLEVFVDAPIAVCEARDPKGLYARARRGELRAFTGVDDPYEPPLFPDLVLATASWPVHESVRAVMDALTARRIIVPPEST